MCIKKINAHTTIFVNLVNSVKQKFQYIIKLWCGYLTVE